MTGDVEDQSTEAAYPTGYPKVFWAALVVGWGSSPSACGDCSSTPTRPWPPIRTAANGGNPSILPQDYGRGLLTVLTAVWIVTAAALLVWSWRRSKPGAMSPDDVGL